MEGRESAAPTGGREESSSAKKGRSLTTGRSGRPSKSRRSSISSASVLIGVRFALDVVTDERLCETWWVRTRRGRVVEWKSEPEAGFPEASRRVMVDEYGGRLAAAARVEVRKRAVTERRRPCMVRGEVKGKECGRVTGD